MSPGNLLEIIPADLLDTLNIQMFDFKRKHDLLTYLIYSELKIWPEWRNSCEAVNGTKLPYDVNCETEINVKIA